MKLVRKKTIEFPNYASDHRKHFNHLSAQFKSKNIPKLLALEQIGYHSFRDQAIFSLIRDNNITYSKAYGVQKKRAIYLQNDKAWLDDLKKCDSLFGKSGPALIWDVKEKNTEFLQNRKLGRTSEVLILEPQTYETIDKDKRCTQVAYVLYLIDNWIYRVHPDTGDIMKEIYLSPKKDDVSYTLFQFDPHSELVIASSSPVEGVQRIALFKISPLRFYAMFDLTNTVIPHFKKAEIYNDMLIVHYHYGGRHQRPIQLFDIRKVLAQNQPYCQCDLGQECPRHGPLGVKDNGILPNYTITTLGEPLFAISAAKFYGIDCFPYHTILKNFNKNQFIIQDLLTGETLASRDRTAGDKDFCYFMGDLSNRVLLKTSSCVEICSLKFLRKLTNLPSISELSGSSEVAPSSSAIWKDERPRDQIRFSFSSEKTMNISSRPKRRASTNVSYVPKEPLVLQVCCDYDLQVIAILHRGMSDHSELVFARATLKSVLPEVANPDSGVPRKRKADTNSTSGGTKGSVSLYDMRTGVPIHSFALDINLDSANAYAMFYCAEYIAITEEQVLARNFKLHLYRLKRVDY
ncbi:DDB1- and CUL4-associated factor 17 [Halotydeus destructor]|nr:DDB1- and CUL4-associated factor 17 [Halotydeus destructor]